MVRTASLLDIELIEDHVELESKFKDKSARVLVIESSSTSRSIISEVLKGLGFQDIQSMDSVKAALGYIEVEHADWVLMPLMIGESVNALHLLEIFTQFPRFEKMRSTILIDDSEKAYLTSAFELGLMSYIKRQYTKDSLKAEFTAMLGVLKKHEWDPLMTATDFLTSYLKEQSRTKSLLALYESLSKHLPESSNVVLGLAEAQALNGDLENAKRTLGRAQLLGVQDWEAAVKTMLPAGENPIPDLGIKTVVLADPDEMIHRSFANIFAKYGDIKLITFSDGEAASKWLAANPQPDLLLQEWKLAKVPGQALIQRLRQGGFHTLPIIIISSLLTQKDTPLLNEMTAANVIQKPFGEADCLKTILLTLQQERNPTTHAGLERKLHQCLQSGDNERAQRCFDRLSIDATYPEGHKKYLKSLFAFFAQKFDEAKALAVEALQKNAEPVKAFNHLGRCLASLRDFEGASKCFKKAQDASPANVERLCELAAVQSEMGQDEAAAATLNQAKSIDASSEKVLAQDGKIALKKGDSKRAKQIMAHMNSLGGLVSDMNNAAVVLIRSGDFEAGIAIYESTIAALPLDKDELRMKVFYNLALAHSRHKNLQEALSALERSPMNPEVAVNLKIQSLLARVRHALQNKEDLKLHTSALTVPARSEGTPENTQVPASVDPWEDSSGRIEVEDASDLATAGIPGARCCHLLFKAVEPLEPHVTNAMLNPPKFKVRAAIEREDSMGVERMMR